MEIDEGQCMLPKLLSLWGEMGGVSEGNRTPNLRIHSPML
jgi:hypothetical protein